MAARLSPRLARRAARAGTRRPAGMAANLNHVIGLTGRTPPGRHGRQAQPRDWLDGPHVPGPAAKPAWPPTPARDRLDRLAPERRGFAARHARPARDTPAAATPTPALGGSESRGRV
jgi:hypothetical protein